MFNGLLLGAAYDAAFDAGLITFGADGKIIVSDALSDEQRDVAGLSTDAVLRLTSDQHQEYLAYHRSSIFEGTVT